MEKEVIEYLDNLLKEGLNWGNKITKQQDASFGLIYYTVSNGAEYDQWKMKSIKFLKDYADIDYSKFESVKSGNNGLKRAHDTIYSALVADKASAHLPKPKEKEKEGSSSLVNIVNNLSQTQSQEISLSIFIEAIKEELWGKQQKEIKAIIEENKGEPEKAKTKIIEKFKSFGSDLLSNILANIITNPTILGGF